MTMIMIMIMIMIMMIIMMMMIMIILSQMIQPAIAMNSKVFCLKIPPVVKIATTKSQISILPPKDYRAQVSRRKIERKVKKLRA